MSYEYKKFNLHDCVVTSIGCRESSITFVFNSGIYIDDCDEKTNYSEIAFIIDGLEESKEYEHIYIYLQKNQKRKEINFSKLRKIIEKRGLQIVVDLYSKNFDVVCIKGFSAPFKIEILMTEVKDIRIKF